MKMLAARCAVFFAATILLNSSAKGQSIDVFVGYADSLRANPVNFPSPWYGSPFVEFKGCAPSTCTYDAGAVMVTNHTGVPVTVNSVEIDIDTCHFNMWPSTLLPADNSLIATQFANAVTGGCVMDGSLDTSDVGPGGSNYASNCTRNHIIPVVKVTVNGTTSTYSDTGQVLNTGGFDLAACPSGTNESTQWTAVGSATCGGAILTLAPTIQNLPVGPATLQATTLTNCSGVPLANAQVDFAVLSGPNAGLRGAAVTDSNGVASFTYSSSLAGTDTIQSSVTNIAGTFSSNNVTVTWQPSSCVGVVCSPLDQCHVATCDSSTGTCSNQPVPDNTICNNNACPQIATCQSGMCSCTRPTPVPACCGDSDGNGSISTAEATKAIIALVNRDFASDPAAQCTTPGTITTADVTKIILNLVNRACSLSPSPTITPTLSATRTPTVSFTPTQTLTRTPTSTATSSYTATFTQTSTATTSVSNTPTPTGSQTPGGTVLFHQDFESGLGNWSTDNGIWQVGSPSPVPSPYAGLGVAGTILNGPYPGTGSSHLISPAFNLPAVTDAERIEVRFWQWYTYSTLDRGEVHIQQWDGAAWSAWVPIATPAQQSASSDWSRAAVDLTAYAGQRVRLGFYHTASCYYSNCSDTTLGWYIDEVEIWKGVPEFGSIHGFENGWGDWHAEEGVWQIGAPSPGPSPYAGSSVAGTELKGNYPANTSSRLVSPEVVLPVVSGDERVEVRFWQWYTYSTLDRGEVHIQQWDGAAWSAWASIATPAQQSASSDWSRAAVDLTAYAGQRVRLGFYHTASCYYSNCSDTTLGWYIDEVEIWKGVPEFGSIHGFENGWGDWHAEEGVWQIGAPSPGPSPYAGSSVAGTELKGNYPANTSSRLVSPEVVLPVVSGDERVEVRFWQWYTYSTLDRGEVHIQQWDGAAWSAWASIATPAQQSASSDWSRAAVDLTAYAGQRVRLGFYHTASCYYSNCSDTTLGWYIDEVEIWKGVPEFGSIHGFENGWGDWHAEEGVWQIGAPSPGPSPYAGSSVAGTELKGNYPANTSSRLVSPEVVLPVVSGDERVEVRFWQWYTYSTLDRGEVHIQQWDGAAWSAWASIATPAQQSASSDWSRAAVDLTAYAGQRVRLGFYHTASCYYSNCSDTTLGWYIDEVEIWKGVPEFGSIHGFENGWGDWHAEEGVWQIGAPSPGPSPYAGSSVAGTELKGNYPANTSSRLVSPEVVLPVVSGDERVEVRFWQWYTYSTLDRGEVHIQQWDGTKWSVWASIATPAQQSASSDWSRAAVDLTAYAGQRVRLGFYHTASCYYSNCSDTALGWYIDEVEIWKGVPGF